MHKHQLTITLAALGVTLVTLVTPAARAAEGDGGPGDDAGLHIGVDSDPSMFALGGYSAWLTGRVPLGNGLRLGGGLFALDVPAPVSTLLNGGIDGFHMRLNGYMAHASYFLTRDGRGGLYSGAYVGALETQYRRAEAPKDVASVWHATVMPMIGYQWFPLENDEFHVGDFPLRSVLAGFYVEPWLGASIWFPVAGEPVVAGKRFHEPPGVPFPAVHIGWEL